MLGPNTISVLKVIFLPAAEISGTKARPKNYENSHENRFGLSVVLALKVFGQLQLLHT